jgi:hypothetical protein
MGHETARRHDARMNETLGETLRTRFGRTMVALDRLRPAPSGLRPVPLAVPAWSRRPTTQRRAIRPIRSWTRLTRI